MENQPAFFPLGDYSDFEKNYSRVNENKGVECKENC